MSPPTLDDIRDAAAIVYRAMPPTPQYRWPLLSQAVGADIVVKHENHTPTGAFKVRGGLVYVDWQRRERPDIAGIVSATRGNHGQSLAFAAARAGLACTLVVPHGNSVEKNAAMRGFGADLVEHGADFDEARAEAARVADERGLAMVPSFHAELVRGVASYALELFDAFGDLDAVYVPIGLGSGICGLIGARNALGLRTQIIGVVAEAADAYRRSVAAGKVVETASAATFADGMAVRVPSPDAFAVIRRGAERLVSVNEAEVAAAMRCLWRATHNPAEGAGAAGLAALLQERGAMAGKKVAIVLSGQNIDADWFRLVLAGGVPAPEMPDVQRSRHS